MGNPTKTKAAMLNELESIKGLLLEQDDIPILQEAVLEQRPDTETMPLASETIQEQDAHLTTPNKAVPAKTIFEEQQDFFSSPSQNESHLSAPTNTNISNSAHSALGSTDHNTTTAAAMELVESELLDTLNELEKHTAEVTAGKLARDSHKHNIVRPNLAKATGENPFLPEHIRARLHGNNPPPLFATQTAKKIATSSIPSRQLGNTFTVASNARSHQQQDTIEDIIESIVEKIMPEIEQELRSRLEVMSKSLLEELNK
jgi:hypothetical protein